ncbi:MAG: SAM-dependent methyltransferase [Kordiimonas sp.]|nr:SAM-dependent methyltransferase [Kordiimonas sp.]|tara:strand:+ start:295 stop:1041 length:747 start_codon:yes stop_codon:yes gene_type:complete
MNYDLLIDLHKAEERQGPGGETETLQALQLSGLMEKAGPLQIADIGCGTGASTLLLAEYLKADITAVDLFPAFLERLKERAKAAHIQGHITPLLCSMESLPFAPCSLDAIWSEGAIYNMGFAAGIAAFKPFLKQGGILAVSEITWLTNQRPPALTQYWDSEYPEIATAAEKIRILENEGFIIKGYFPLPESCWRNNYYAPLQSRFNDFLTAHDTPDARAIVLAEQDEIKLYEQYCQYYSYGFYIAQKT